MVLPVDEKLDLMLFNSINFFIFLSIVLIIYYITPVKYRWWILLISSYYFYLSYDVLYSILLFFITTSSYFLARRIESETNDIYRKRLLFTSLSIILGSLFIFKYFDFAIESLSGIMFPFGVNLNYTHINILVPLGISFYTLQVIGYVLDVYLGEINAEKHLGYYSLFVAFFPQIIAGPIGRSTSLLVQHRSQNYFSSRALIAGAKWIIWGLFLKLVIADRLGLYVDAVYNNVGKHSGLSFVLGSLFYTFQVYCDFAGYSLIALGTSKLFNIDLINNFNLPYFSVSVTDFWRRWHISLSSWLRDYVFVPLGLTHYKIAIFEKYRVLVAIVITFFISGLWHGASWTFIIWGIIHGIYLILESLFRVKSDNITIWKQIFKIPATFILVSFAWIFFRASSLNDVFIIFNSIFSYPGQLYRGELQHLVYSVMGIILLITIESIFYFNSKNYTSSISKHWFIEQIKYAVLILTILLIGVFDGGQFIYFQF